MSGAELKVLLTGLGLTPAWLADRLGTTRRTLIRWFDLDQVPDSVLDEMERIEDYTDEQIVKMLTLNQGVLHTRRTDEGGSQSDPLPATWHRAATYRALQHCRASGIKTRIAYIPSEQPAQQPAQ